MTLEAANSVYNTLIQPISDYADTSWGVLSEACNNELQRLQNRAARIVLRRNRTENCLSSLNWLHLSTRRKIRCVLVFKILNNCVPVYFNDYFTKNSNVHSFNTRHKNNFVLPKVKRELGKRTFRYAGAKDYNDLSTDIKNVLLLTSFKTRIKHYFKSK